MGLAAAGVLAVVLAAGAGPDPISPAARGELGAHGYQTSMPGPPALGPADGAARHGHTRVPEEEPGSAPGALGSVASMLLWVIAAVAVGVAAVWFAREVLGFSPAPDADGETGDGAEARAAVVERPLDDAETLARTGRYAEAVHILLLRTLEALAARTGVPPSLTSREILGRVRLPGEAHGALAGLVVAVEVSHFGGEPPGAADFDVCRAQFHRFARAYAEAAR